MYQLHDNNIPILQKIQRLSSFLKYTQQSQITAPDPKKSMCVFTELYLNIKINVNMQASYNIRNASMLYILLLPI